MYDRISQNPGRVLITPEDGSGAFYATLALADNPTVVGTPLNKASLLSDATAALYGLSRSAVPDDVLEKARSLITTAQNTANSAVTNANSRLKLISGSYVGTKSVGDNAGPGYPTVINMGVNPVAVFIASCRKSGTIYSTSYTAIPWTQGGVGFVVETGQNTGFNVVAKTNPFTFYDGGQYASTSVQLNLSNYTYYWAALYY